MKNLWAGRFEKGMDTLVESFNASILFDRRLYKYDIMGSIAHVTMLAEQGIVSEEDRERIVACLCDIERDIEAGNFAFSVGQEDIHMAVEGELIRRLGEPGKRLHTARSRNDQAAVDTHLYVRGEMEGIIGDLALLCHVLLQKAEVYAAEPMSGFTHMQHAQPVTIGFHLMAYFQMFRRDVERLQDALERVNINPLGACALAGTTMPIDRHRTTELLGFSAPSENAMDTVSNRDYVLEFLSAASISMMHVSRMAEEFVYWNSQEFGYISIDDSFCTGSSIMPQKKNPDVAELLRGKAGRVYGDLMALLTVMTGKPLSYNKDFQEDKEALFDAVDTWRTCIVILAKMIEKTAFNTDTIRAHMQKGFLAATDVAEFLVGKGIPFRRAHEIVGRMVKHCEQAGCDLGDIGPDILAGIDPDLAGIEMPDFSMMGCIKARTSFGGTAPDEVMRQVGVGMHWLATVAED